MNEEELFCKLFPEYVVNGKPLSPYFDLFQSGYEEADKRIEELEKENKEVHINWLKVIQENAEAKERIKTLEYRCENIKDTDTMELVALQRENADLQKSHQDLYNSMRVIKDQLTKATEIIKKLYAVYYDPCVTESDLKYRDELFAEIKQFLSEVEK